MEGARTVASAGSEETGHLPATEEVFDGLASLVEKIEAGGFDRSREDLPAPDLQYAAIASTMEPDPEHGMAQPGWRGVSTLVIGLDVRSRGRLTLRSADPLEKPLIDPAYLADASDLDMLAEGVRRAREIAAQEPLSDHIAREHAPGEKINNDAGLREWIRRNVGTIFHPTSTCAMGGTDEAVCDPELRVRGVEGLRVVDASVMPTVPRGNTNAPTIAIAERAVNLIMGKTPHSSQRSRLAQST